MPFELAPLPFEKDALVPHISSRTMGLHYDKHHHGYVHNLNRLTFGTPQADMPLEEVVLTALPGPIFNNAAQAWNHAFFWDSLKPDGGGVPTGDLAQAIVRDFGAFDALKERLVKAAVSLFGSGWAWLVAADGKLMVTQTSNADTPMKHGQVPLLTLDVWEHAYYLDYRQARARYVEAIVGHLVNWDFAAANFALGAKSERVATEGGLVRPRSR